MKRQRTNRRLMVRYWTNAHGWPDKMKLMVSMEYVAPTETTHQRPILADDCTPRPWFITR